jgi:hypothetical protein
VASSHKDFKVLYSSYGEKTDTISKSEVRICRIQEQCGAMPSRISPIKTLSLRTLSLFTLP